MSSRIQEYVQVPFVTAPDGQICRVWCGCRKTKLTSFRSFGVAASGRIYRRYYVLGDVFRLGPDASVSQYPTRQFVPSVWVQATYHARVCVTTCYQSSGTLTRTNHIVRCAGLSCPRNYAISGLCKRRTLFVDAFISAIEWPRIPAWRLKRKASFWNLIPRWSFSFVSISIFFAKKKKTTNLPPSLSKI